MTRVLLTAFEPYGGWDTNSSWLALVELAKDLPRQPEVTTRRYPVDFAQVRERLAQDLTRDYDFALHLGQAPDQAGIALEAVGLNVRSPARNAEEGDFGPIVDDGPAAYFSALPLSSLAARLRAAGFPARVSHHAGTYVCNATLYLAHYLVERMALTTRIAFVHLPFETSQVAAMPKPAPSLPATVTAAALRELLAALAELHALEV